jgi:exopolysaccharide biosynthesis polyprenyl glycosylphosphotransferase
MFKAATAVRTTTLILVACDANFPIFVLAGYGAVRHGDPLAVLLAQPWLLLTAFAFPVSFALAQRYQLRSAWGSLRASARIVAATLAVVGLFALASHLVGGLAGQRQLFTVLAVAMVAEVFGVRGFVDWRSRRARAIHAALVVGAGTDGCTVIDCTLRDPRLRVRVVGFIDDDPLKRNHQHRGVSVLGTGENLFEAAMGHAVDLVVVAVNRPQNAPLINNLLHLKMRGVEVIEMPAFYERATGQCPLKHVHDSWFLYSAGFDYLHRPYLQILKRGIDLLLSLLGLVLSLPLLGIVAILIRLESRGPTFAHLERVGKDESRFSLLKFRTMRGDAGPPGALEWADVRDYRVTRIGRLLRQTRLDEIPQFINVVRGEMSFVGPRAEQPLIVERLKKDIPYFMLRFAVRPGLTGWAQVQNGFGTTSEDAVEKLKYDLYYMKNMSPMLDGFIVLKTLKVVLFARGN